MASDDERQFAGKVAVVTGGTQGLGESVAMILAERGAAGIIICGRNAKAGRAVVRALRGTGCEAHFVEADLSQVEAAQKVIARADRAFKRIDVLVNVAATTDRGTILDTTPELFDRMFAVNVRAPFFLIQGAARIMRREKTAGTIVNIQSMSAHGGQPFITAYSASKAALAALTRNVAFGLMPDHIRVNGLNVGWMDTPGEHSIQMRYHTADPEWLAGAEQAQPFGRLIKPQEVARAVAFLASEESGLMTGAVIDFDQQVLGSNDTAPHPRARLPDASP